MKLKKLAAAATLATALAGGAVALAPTALAAEYPCPVPNGYDPDSCRTQEYFSGGRLVGHVHILWFNGRDYGGLEDCQAYRQSGRVVGTSCRVWHNA